MPLRYVIVSTGQLRRRKRYSAASIRFRLTPRERAQLSGRAPAENQQSGALEFTCVSGLGARRRRTPPGSPIRCSIRLELCDADMALDQTRTPSPEQVDCARAMVPGPGAYARCPVQVRALWAHTTDLRHGNSHPTTPVAYPDRVTARLTPTAAVLLASLALFSEDRNVSELRTFGPGAPF